MWINHDSRYNFSSQLPPFQPNIYQIPQEYVPIITTISKSISYDSKFTPDNLDQLLFHMIQFGGAQISSNRDVNSNWFEIKKGKNKSQKKIRPSQKLLEDLNNQAPFEYQHLQRDWSRMQVDDELISNLNKFYGDNVELSLPSSIIGAPANWEELRRNFHSIPFLRPSENSGGRLFHKGVSYQMVPKNLRKMMRVNSEEPTEFDVNAASLRFLYLSGEFYGIKFPKELILLDDPYDYFSKFLSRDSAKAMTYAIVFSSEEKEKKAMERKLEGNERFQSSEDFKCTFPDFFDALKAYKSQHQAPHIPLFEEETKFTREVIKRCLQEEISILPIHDSYITTQSRQSDLEAILASAQRELYGDQLLKMKQEY